MCIVSLTTQKQFFIIFFFDWIKWDNSHKIKKNIHTFFLNTENTERERSSKIDEWTTRCFLSIWKLECGLRFTFAQYCSHVYMWWINSFLLLLLLLPREGISCWSLWEFKKKKCTNFESFYSVYSCVYIFNSCILPVLFCEF